MKISDEDLEKLLRACVRADGGFQGQVNEMGAAYRARQVIAELLALRKVATVATEALMQPTDSVRHEEACEDLLDALKEAGYDA